MEPAAAAGAVRPELLVLDEIESMLGDTAGVSEARARAEALAVTIGDAREAARLAGLTFAAETLAASWLDRQWKAREIEKLVAGIAAALGIDPSAVRTAVFVRAIRDRQVLDLPPQLGAETVLMMFCTFTEASSASLWTATDEGRLDQMIRTGEDDSSRRTRAAAREAIAEARPVTSPRSQLHAVPVERWGRPAAALVFRSRTGGRLNALAYAAEAAIALAPLIEFDALLGRNATREQSLTAASERRLTRLGFDLHDGPMQDIAALAADLRLFRRQLGSLLAGDKDSVRVLGRVDDLEARLVGIDKELRELARSLQSPAGLRVPLDDAVRHEVDKLRSRSTIQTELTLSGEFDALTASQKIALVRVAQEAISNVQEHSEASSVKVRLTATRTRLGLEVVDDGRGFDVQQRLLEAARGGRLGLVGMGERIRLLGGRFDLESTPGSGTRVRVSLPRWRPLSLPEELRSSGSV